MRSRALEELGAMKGIPQDYMKVGLVHFEAFPQCAGGEGPIAETVESVANDDFFEAIEITQIRAPLVRRMVRNLIIEARLEPLFGAQPITLGRSLDLNHPDKAKRQRAIGAVRWGINQAKELECRTVAVLSGTVNEDQAAATERLVDSLKQICEAAHAKGIRVVLETSDQVSYGKNCLIGPTAEAVAVSETIREDYPDFGLMLNLSHLPLLEESPEHAVTIAREHLVHAHIGNCAMDDPEHPAFGDNHPRFGAAGTRNDVPELTAFLKALMDVGYLSTSDRNVVSLEVKPLSGENESVVIAGSKRALSEAWRRL